MSVRLWKINRTVVTLYLSTSIVSIVTLLPIIQLLNLIFLVWAISILWTTKEGRGGVEIVKEDNYKNVREGGFISNIGVALITLLSVAIPIIGLLGYATHIVNTINNPDVIKVLAAFFAPIGAMWGIITWF